MDDTSLVILGVAAAAATKILGPTADYLGQSLQAWAADRLDNIRRIFANAETKLGDAIDQEGSVPPRVFGRILEEGSYASDPMATEYLGGILASSRSGITRDDRGAMMVSLVARLSTYQLRTHYIFYSVAHTLLRGRDIAFTINASREENRVLIPFMEYVRAMDYYAGEDIGVLLSHAVHGLAEEGLIDSFASGSPEVLAQLGFTNVPGAAVAFQTSALGVELFLWAHGLSGTHINDFLNVPIASEITSQMNLPSHASVAGELPPIPDDVMAMAQELQTMVAGALAEGVSLPPYPMRPPE